MAKSAQLLFDRLLATRLQRCLLLVVLLLGLPLAGAWFAGQPLAVYWVFPPLPQPRAVTPFSWRVFISIAVLVIVVVGPVAYRVWRSKRTLAAPPQCHFPWWGWPGLCLILFPWIMAWTRQEWFASMQQYTFAPLWFGYIVCVNALCFRRSGCCMLLDRPGYFLALFPISMVLWTCFEWLNLGVRNWYYPGVSDLTVTEYLLHSSLPFSTVLPAVLGTTAWLRSYPRLSSGLNPWLTLRLPSIWPSLMLLAGVVGMVMIGAWPDRMYPLLWVAPLMLVWALQTFNGQETPFTDLARGDWRSLWLPALAALFCGFWWELWNVYSLAHWRYMIPGIGRFYLFEMPILGYSGYLPFGLFCVAVTEYLLLRGR